MNTPPNAETTLRDDVTCGLGEIRLLHPPNTFQITPASLISIETIGNHKHLLQGSGIDWGCGGGCLSVAAAKIAGVDQVIGLDISEANTTTAQENARLNGVEAKTQFLHSDSYVPFSTTDQNVLERMKGRINFILANPPSYAFCNPLQPAESLNARASLALYEKTEHSPLSRWQTHLFRYRPHLS